MTRFCPIVHSDLAAAVHSVDTLMATERERPDGVDASAEDLIQDAVEDLLADVIEADARAVLVPAAAAKVSIDVCADAVEPSLTPAAAVDGAADAAADVTAVAAATAPPLVSPTTAAAAGMDSYPSSKQAASAEISVVLSAQEPMSALVRLSVRAKNRVISGDRGT